MTETAPTARGSAAPPSSADGVAAAFGPLASRAEPADGAASGLEHAAGSGDGASVERAAQHEAGVIDSCEAPRADPSTAGACPAPEAPSALGWASGEDAEDVAAEAQVDPLGPSAARDGHAVAGSEFAQAPSDPFATGASVGTAGAGRSRGGPRCAPPDALTRLGWLARAGVADHLVTVPADAPRRIAEAAIDLVRGAAAGPVFRVGAERLAFPLAAEHADDLAAALAEHGLAVEPVGPPADLEDAPPEAPYLVALSEAARGAGPLDAELAFAAAARTAEAVAEAERGARDAAAAAGDALAARLATLAPEPEIAAERLVEALAARLAASEGPGAVLRTALAPAAPAGAEEATLRRIDALAARLERIERAVGEVADALARAPDVRRERDGLLMYGANLRFILDNLDVQAGRLGEIVAGLAAGDAAAADETPEARALLGSLDARLAALEARPTGPDPADTAAIRAALAELVAAESRRALRGDVER